MAALVLGVGTGVLLITIIWIIAFISGMVLLRASGTTKLGVLPVVILALIITLGLVFFPRTSETPSPFREKEIVDTFFIGRYVLLTASCLVFLVAVVTLLVQHLLTPVYATPLRSHRTTF